MNCSAGNVRLKNVHKQSKIVTAEVSYLLQDKKYYEAIDIIKVLKIIHPEDTTLDNMYNFIPEEIRNEYEKRSVMLGSNYSGRKKVEKSLIKKIFLYVPDKFLDFFDIFSLELSLGPQLGAEAWITRGAQVSAYAGMPIGFGLLGKKQLGYHTSAMFNLSLGPFGIFRKNTMQLGTYRDINSFDNFYIHKPSRDIYQTHEDYWSIGVHAGLGIFGFRFEIHPYEIYDFFTGFAGFDPGNDDMAKTDPLDYTYEQNQHLNTLNLMIYQMGKNGLAEYIKKYPTIAQDGPLKKFESNPEENDKSPIY